MFERNGRWVTRYSARGCPVQVWERQLPRIADRLLECIVYLYPSEAAAEDGLRLGGSGFIVGIHLDPPHNKHVLRVIVTNKHVVDNGNMVVRVNTSFGGKDVIALDGENWIASALGDDLAVCPIKLDQLIHRHNYVPRWQLITQRLIEELVVGPGDDVFFIGRFMDKEGRERNLPSVRFGAIAQMPIEPIILEGGIKQDSFLIEARSISGYSGSPVFLYFQSQPAIPGHIKQIMNDALPKYITAREFTNYGLPLEPYLLGVDYCHIFSEKPVLNRHTGEPHPDWCIRSNTGMMGVVPAWKLNDLLDQAEMKRIIENAKKNIQPADRISLDIADELSALSTESNPTHQEDFNRLLGAAARKREQED